MHKLTCGYCGKVHRWTPARLKKYKAARKKDFKGGTIFCKGECTQNRLIAILCKHCNQTKLRPFKELTAITKQFCDEDCRFHYRHVVLPCARRECEEKVTRRKSDHFRHGKTKAYHSRFCFLNRGNMVEENLEYTPNPGGAPDTRLLSGSIKYHRKELQLIARVPTDLLRRWLKATQLAHPETFTFALLAHTPINRLTPEQLSLIQREVSKRSRILLRQGRSIRLREFIGMIPIPELSTATTGKIAALLADMKSRVTPKERRRISPPTKSSYDAHPDEYHTTARALLEDMSRARCVPTNTRMLPQEHLEKGLRWVTKQEDLCNKSKSNSKKTASKKTRRTKAKERKPCSLPGCETPAVPFLGYCSHTCKEISQILSEGGLAFTDASTTESRKGKHA